MVAGRRAVTAMLEAEKFVSAREEQLIGEMVARYRSGQTDHDFTIGRVAELSAGRYLLTEMKRSLTQETENG